MSWPEGRELTLLVPAIVGLALIAGWFLVMAQRGEMLIWSGAPGGPLAFRLVRRSRLALLVRSLLRIRNPDWINALGCWGTVHWSHHALTPHLLAHELGHLIRARGRPTRYVLRYIADPGFRAEEEEACEEFAARWRDSPSLLALAAGGDATAAA